MADCSLDFTNTFRVLCQFKSTSDRHFDRFLDLLLPSERLPSYQAKEARPTWTAWLEAYERRLAESEKRAELSLNDRQTRMQTFNPRFTLRQWVLEEAIKRLEEAKDTAFLSQVLSMCEKPFEACGEILATDGSNEACPTPQTLEERRLCGMGDTRMLGFQCSCSS